MKEEKLREYFSAKGTITDLQLKYTKEGVFRRFAFVGYKDEAQAAAAKEYFHNAYLDTSRLQVSAHAFISVTGCCCVVKEDLGFELIIYSNVILEPSPELHCRFVIITRNDANELSAGCQLILIHKKTYQ